MVSNRSTAGLRLAALLVTAAVVVGACGGGDDSGSNGGGETQSVEVTAADFAFDPTTIEAEPGQEIEVTFVNNDSADHTFTVEDLDVDVQAAPGETADVTFTAPDSGTVEFVCSFHDQMIGEVSVDGAASGSDSSDSGGRGAYDLD